MAYNPITLPGPFTVGQTIAVTFPYEKQADIRVTVDGVLIDPSHYSWPTSSSIQLLGTFPALGGALLSLSRRTDDDELLGELTTSSAFDYELTNKNFERLLFLNQETNSNADGAVSQVLQARDDVEDDRAEVAVNLADIIVRQADVVTRQGDVTTRQADVASKQSDVVTKHGDVVTKHGDVVTKHAAVIAAEATTLAARDATLAAFDSFDDRYLGAKASDPVLDNDGNPLQAGQIYFNTGSGSMRIYSGAVWGDAYVDPTGLLVAASNLNDLPNKATARLNLGAHNASNLTAGTLDDARLSFSVSAFAKTLLDDGTQGAAQGTLGVYSTGQVDTLVNAKANINSPTFTGVPTAPTAPNGTNNTQLATTQFVNANSGKALKLIFTSSGTWTKPTAANFLYAVVTVVAGGGGGGGIGSTNSNTANASAGMGAAGGISIKKILAASLGATETVTVGAGGSAGAAGNNAGGAGGTSSFGSHCAATGGAGGSGSSGASGGAGIDLVAPGGDGGVGSTGDISGKGSIGFVQWGSIIGTFTLIQAGQGPLGFGAATMGRVASGAVAGNAGSPNSGAGGAGAQHYNVTTTAAGGAGGSGLIIVEEYYGS